MQYLDETGHFSDVKGAGGAAAAAPTVDNLTGTGVTGKALMKAADAAAALTALGTAKITAQTKPADLKATGATADEIAVAVNALSALLKTAGVLK